MALLKACVLFSALLVIANCDVLSFNKNKDVVAGIEVRCTDAKMQVIFDRTQLNSRDDANNDRPSMIGFFGQKTVSSCNFNGDGLTTQLPLTTSFTSYIYLDAALPDGCGMNEFEDMENIIYNQTVVVTWGNNSGIIRREEYDYYNVMCLRKRNNMENITGDYFNTTFRETGEDAKNATADFDFTFEHKDGSDQTKTEYKLGEKIKFKMTMNTGLSTVKAVIQKCWSTSDGSSSEYKLIENGCYVDSLTTLLGSWSPKESAFQTFAYSYLGSSTSSIYVECLVRVCLSATSSSQCTDGCDAKRRRRDVNGNSDGSSLQLVKAPIFYIVEANGNNDNQKSESIMSGTNGAIVIALLAVLVFVVALGVIKKVFFNAATVQVPNVSMKGIENNGMA